MYCVYIIYSEKNKKIYKGSCEDIKIRLQYHNQGKVTSTKNGKPWKLIYCEFFTNKTDALIEEKFLKSGKGRERIKYLLTNTLKEKIQLERWPSGCQPEAGPPWAERQ
jgi:putative endonuclease